ncbi:MAG TPA: HEAT repeat domain-containing protein [Nitrospirales bacterium]|nr:HEAT repeat domain-containing protein [Nitrospirales bacterium]
MRAWATCGFITIVLLVGLFGSEGLARRTYLDADQKAKLDAIQTILIHVLALTEHGKVDGTVIEDVVRQRLEELGYTVVISRDVPYDVRVNVKCEEQKTWSGTTRAGGDADQIGSPSRLWKGPACLFSYQLDGRDLGWYKEARTKFEDSGQAAQAANAPQPGPYAIQELAKQIREFDFPVMLAAEWGHNTRLFKLLNNPQTPNKRKIRIFSLMPQVESQQYIPLLKELIQDPEIAEEAIVAMSSAGSEAIPILTEIFHTQTDSAIRAAAAKGLGEIASLTGDPTITPPMLAYVVENLSHIKTSSDIDFPVMTEVVWSLGKLRNAKAVAPISELENKIWVIHDNSKEMAELREATSWTYKQIEMDSQIQ